MTTADWNEIRRAQIENAAILVSIQTVLVNAGLTADWKGIRQAQIETAARLVSIQTVLVNAGLTTLEELKSLELQAKSELYSIVEVNHA